MNRVIVNESPLEFPYTKLTFQGDFGEIPKIDAYYIIQSIQDQYGEVRVSWIATVLLQHLTLDSSRFYILIPHYKQYKVC